MDVTFRTAAHPDLEAIVELLATDVLGATRERFELPLPKPYVDAFAAIDADPRNVLVVGEVDGAVVATMQLTFIPSITFVGGERALVEGVRVADSVRGLGVGAALLQWGIDEARRRNCRLVELTTNNDRVDAKRFYERLGFVDSHHGLKLDLRP
jgi:GNAT superfamily N-acetyltransferase